MGGSKNHYMQNREISWLRFNQRVLWQGKSKGVPLLERLKFIEIFSSNLDEFFMIRMGTLYNMKKMKPQHIDEKSGMTIKEEIVAILEKVSELYKERDEVYRELVMELKKEGISEVALRDIDFEEMLYIKRYFKSCIKPVLAPQIIDKHHPFPHIRNMELHYVAFIKYHRKKTFAMIPIPSSIPKLIFLKGETIRYIRVEKIIEHFATSVFSGGEIIESNIIKVTRNEDLNFGIDAIGNDSDGDDLLEDDIDFRDEMKGLLHKRKRLSVVRMEFMENISSDLSGYLGAKLKIRSNQMFASYSPLVQNEFKELVSKIDDDKREIYIYKSYTPTVPKELVNIKSMMKEVKKKDILLSYPYESMEPFLRLIKEASVSNKVLAIKITIYRLSSHPKLIDYLCNASEKGIAVTVLIELRARFDENQNIYWSERLETAGCNVIYGVKDYKVHSKICLVTYKDGDKISYITQVGTGNYNETTAKVYTDLSLLTANESIGKDAVLFFQNMGMGNLFGTYENLLVGPNEMKSKLLRLIDEQIELGAQGYIGVKINGLADDVIMRRLRGASRAGVKVDLCVRGICCLLPNVKNQTETIRIHSVIGRYLEHSRIYIFGRGDSKSVYISSADWLHRNTDRRVEVALPILDTDCRSRIVDIFNKSMNDNVHGMVMSNSGEFKDGSTDKEKYNSQELMME